ncbi:MBL fold metallo-hydrolase [Treponema phagedenis]|uniref:MBL fold metallo-hydrolase n=1 Tax=Treponema phagedenis TaxID=162 RepID=A0A0B7GRV1_TREPH|nr:MBL fold metallo-hydrolase [Treponema phagedenis]NVP24753.1 MBL fold metallo-hydrolase [Treponema phagedenis]QEJ95866.1 MBL fold metallo-hydrolase [Treponema phagedenis]QEJ98869.1 MBL fold metallo-hydrolase [Treponema phagedenis]QEK00439.1 MBL fold metallo-hydrolase [Treponema phagedenis]QEK04376.1 MBL fold metallo-hydrolase [Treponema phagedenis]
MRIHFWGVRGSISAPITPLQIQSKIAAVVQRISEKDIKTQKTREQFIAQLPEWIYGTVGGNTTCVEIETNDGETLIFDAGTGIRELGIDLTRRPDYRKKKHTYHLFFTHFHWDHIQGLPFFIPAFDPRNTIIVYSTRKKAKEFLEEQMKYPYFPISMLGEDGFAAKFEFRYIKPDEPIISIGDVDIGWHRVRHPGGCNAYSITEKNGKKVIFSTDTELREQDFEKNEGNKLFYNNTDLMIIDSQYTVPDSIEKQGWGHSTFSIVIDFAASWGIKQVALFHHEPTYDDKKLFSILRSADLYRQHTQVNELRVFLAQEGRDIIL